MFETKKSLTIILNRIAIYTRTIVYLKCYDEIKITYKTTYKIKIIL